MAAVLVVAGCAGDDGDRSAQTTTTTATTSSAVTTATPPSFTGDPDSEFCQLVRAAARRPVRDPFQPGLEPSEVRVRFLALHNRFREFADVAPSGLEADLDRVVQALDGLGALLDQHRYDFERLASEGVDLSLFDDPLFAEVGARLAAYRQQVC